MSQIAVLRFHKLKTSSRDPDILFSIRRSRIRVLASQYQGVLTTLISRPALLLSLFLILFLEALLMAFSSKCVTHQFLTGILSINLPCYGIH